ncbi:MAG: hypothetical protein ABI880_07515, partial [Acidobacteriota bacterium]
QRERKRGAAHLAAPIADQVAREVAQELSLELGGDWTADVERLTEWATSRIGSMIPVEGLPSVAPTPPAPPLPPSPPRAPRPRP